MDLASYLGSAVRSHRQRLRLSQEELAFRAGLDRTYISGVERGRRNPTVRVAQQIADALETDLEHLFRTAKRLTLKK